VFDYTYKYCDHLEYVHNLGKFVGVPVENNQFRLPAHLGCGYVKVVPLANGLQVLINECVIFSDVRFERKPMPDDSFSLRFDQVRNLKELTIHLEGDTQTNETPFVSGAFLTNSLSGLCYTANAGTEDRCINIYFTAKWLEDNIGIKTTDDVFKNYFSLKLAVLNFEILNLEYRTLMEDIFAADETSPVYAVTIQNRAMLLLEKFLRRLFSKVNATTVPISEATLHQLIKVEAILVSDLFVLPPTIPQLARTAMMSETKLKNAFKAVYGYSLYEYYQKSRMLKARQLLHAKKMSVKEVGSALGFKNLSNFTIAYKKEFNVLPSASAAG
jgi:AraC-like DNA-binding protein